MFLIAQNLCPVGKVGTDLFCFVVPAYPNHFDDGHAKLTATFPGLIAAQLNPVQVTGVGNPLYLDGWRIDEDADNLGFSPGLLQFRDYLFGSGWGYLPRAGGKNQPD